jgi:nucleosome binding factor SPN SPT16 subunit
VEREKQLSGDNEILQINKGGRKPVFKDLKIRPNLAQGKGTGQLEVHTNGFRYIYN